MAAMDIPPLVPFNIEVESAHGPVLVGIQVFELLPSATATPLLPTRRGNLGNALFYNETIRGKYIYMGKSLINGGFNGNIFYQREKMQLATFDSARQSKMTA